MTCYIVGTSPAYALAIVGAAHIRLRGADQGGTPAALLMDYSPEPCGGILVSESRNITVADITLDVRRPPSTLVEYVGPNEDGQSFSLRAANVTGPDAEAYSFAGLASGRYPWLGAFGTMMPVERYGDDGRWRYIPNGQYLWCDDQKLTQEYPAVAMNSVYMLRYNTKKYASVRRIIPVENPNKEGSNHASCILGDSWLMVCRAFLCPRFSDSLMPWFSDSLIH